MKKVKGMFINHLTGLQKAIFEAWRDVTTAWRRDREARELWEGHQRPEDFFSQMFTNSPSHLVQTLPRSFKSPPSKWIVY